MLEIKVDKIMKQNIVFHIEKQDERLRCRAEFKEEFYLYTSSNGVQIYSCLYPEYIEEVKKLYIRGEHKFCDLNLLTVTIKDFKNIYEAIKEFNLEYQIQEQYHVTM